MKIINETHDDEKFLDVVLTEEELEDIFSHVVLSSSVRIGGQKVNIGIRRTLTGEQDNEE